VIGAILLALAVALGTTQLFQLAYVLFALVLAGLLVGLAGSGSLRYSREIPPDGSVTARRPARFRLRFSYAPRLGGYVVGVRDRLPDPRSFECAGAERKGEVETNLTFPRRGIYEIGPAEIVTADPFGMLRFARRFGEREEVVAYPEVHEISGSLVGGQGDEPTGRSSLVRRGDEFAGLREYRHGDDLRYVSWKSLARTGELYVKDFASQAPRRYTVALDLRRRGIRSPEREVEDAVSAAASSAASLREMGLPFRLVCNDRALTSTEFGSGERAFREVMRLLATVAADGDEALSEVLISERRRLGEGVVIVSRTREEELAGCAGRLRAAGLSVVVVAVAYHTYLRSGGVRSLDREREFMAEVGALEAAGARVLVVRREEGVAGLAGTGGGRVAR
jgi:uncharacterized protein (DUF58 family)